MIKRNGYTYDLYIRPWKKGNTKHEALKWPTGFRNLWERITYAEYQKALKGGQNETR